MTDQKAKNDNIIRREKEKYFLNNEEIEKTMAVYLTMYKGFKIETIGEPLNMKSVLNNESARDGSLRNFCEALCGKN